MRKKIIRILFAVCLIVVMLTSTAFASTTTVHTFNYEITNYGITNHPKHPVNAYLTVEITDVKNNNTHELTVSNVTFKGVKGRCEESEYTYNFDRPSQNQIDLHVYYHNYWVGNYLRFTLKSNGRIKSSIRY